MAHEPATGALVPINFEHIESQIPELKRLDCRLDTITFEPLIDSSNISTESWIRLATTIEEKYTKYNGFVILHGTDTMAYSASALSFMLENLQKPVIFTGSQLPIGMLRTDGRENLITAIELASASQNEMPLVPEVCIYFENKLMRGNRTTKINAEHFNAFDSPNYPPLAEAGIHIRYNQSAIHYPAGNYPFSIHTGLDERVALLKIFPGMQPLLLKSWLRQEEIKAIVLEAYGSGNAPTWDWFLEEIKSFINRGGLVLNVTQCRGGTVEMGRYDTSRVLRDLGVIGGRDITTEAALSKLMVLLGQDIGRDQIIMGLNKPLRGEFAG